MSPAAPEHHHHLACDRCGRVEEIDEAYIRPVAERVAANLGFRIDDARVDFYGLCAELRAAGLAGGGGDPLALGREVGPPVPRSP